MRNFHMTCCAGLTHKKKKKKNALRTPAEPARQAPWGARFCARLHHYLLSANAGQW